MWWFSMQYFYIQIVISIMIYPASWLCFKRIIENEVEFLCPLFAFIISAH